MGASIPAGRLILTSGLKHITVEKGAKYTRNRGPVELRYLEESGTKEEAMQKEAAYKKLTRKQKDALILSKKNLLQ